MRVRAAVNNDTGAADENGIVARQEQRTLATSTGSPSASGGRMPMQ